MDRRDFLIGAAGAIALTGCGSGGAAAPNGAATPAAPAGTWEAIRAEFPLVADHVHMTSFLLVSHPRVVREAIERHRRGLDANPVAYLHQNFARMERSVRTAAAEYLGGHLDEVAMTDSTTMGIGLVYGGLDLQPGQEILTTTHDHIVTHQSLAYRALRGGHPIRKVALYDRPEQASVDQIATRLEKAITPATRIIALTWVHSGTGVKLPIRVLAEVVARANRGRAEADRAFMIVDGVHGFGNQAEAASQLGCDLFIAGCHKWMFGPRGTGLVWGAPEAWKLTRPVIPTFDEVWRGQPFDRMPIASLMTPGGFHSFEHRWALLEAFQFHRALGREAVAKRITELNTRCKQELARSKRVKLITPMSAELSAGIICFDVDGMSPEQVVGKLAADKIVASVTPDFYSPLHARLAPSLVTLEADVDRAVAAVATL